MSLIMDALEKIQREKQMPVPAADLPFPPAELPAGEVLQESVSLSAEAPGAPAWNGFQEISGENRRWIFLGLAAVMAGALAVLLFQKSNLPFSASAARDSAGIFQSTAGPARIAARPLQGVLRGIVRDESGASCLLEDRILRAGDIWRDYQVVSISLKNVTLKDKENRFHTLTLQDS